MQLHTEYLPSLCASRRCLNDPAQGSAYCRGCLDSARRKRMVTLYVIGNDSGMVSIGNTQRLPFKLGNIQSHNKEKVEVLYAEEGMPEDICKKINSLERWRVRHKWYDRQALDFLKES